MAGRPAHPTEERVPEGVNNRMSLSLKGISKSVGGEVMIHPTELELAAGSFNVVLGRTGAGKTTLLRLMAGLDRPTGGRLMMDGQDLTRRSVRRRSVAMVYQEFINYPNLTVFDNVASPLKVAGLTGPEIDTRVRAVAELLHLGDCLHRLPSELSGGQQQRTALARALVKNADLVLLDEPLVNLDYKLREELRLELREIFDTRDAIIVYATADPLEALSLGTNTVVLDKGRVVQQGAASEVYHHPNSVTSAQIFSDPPMNVVPGALENGQIRLGEGDPISLPEHFRTMADGPCLFGVRPNHVLTRRRSPVDIRIRARVELTEISGSETSIHLDDNGVSWISRQHGIHSLDAGETIHVYIEAHRVYAFDPGGGLIAAPEGPSHSRSHRGAYRPHQA
jgi:glycerol transport system ATP-binding protein